MNGDIVTIGDADLAAMMRFFFETDLPLPPPVSKEEPVSGKLFDLVCEFAETFDLTVKTVTELSSIDLVERTLQAAIRRAAAETRLRALQEGRRDLMQPWIGNQP